MFFSTSQSYSSGSGKNCTEVLLHSASVGFGVGIVILKMANIYIFKFIIFCAYININYW